MSAVRLQLVIPFHQPVSASRDELAEASDRCYAPLLEALEAHPAVRVSLHFSGYLVDYLARFHAELLNGVKRMVKAGQAQMLGGLFYGGAPGMLPELDTRGQVEMTTEFCESLIGEAPRGFWLDRLAWCVELPRLLAETGLEYGFVSRSQVAGDGQPPAMGLVERGGAALGAFVLDPGLSSSLPFQDPEEWLDTVASRATGEARLVSAWVRAESLGLEPGTAELWRDHGGLGPWLEGLAARHPELETVLPQESWVAHRPVPRLQVRDVIAPELEPLLRQPGPATWAQFTGQFAEADTLYRRVLRASAKLRDAITTMDEDGLEDDWSDKLATAQRQIFMAQTTDTYWRGPEPGFSDPKLRDAVLGRVSAVEAIIDLLVQGEEDWISTEEEDRDGDLVEEVFVSNRHLTAWIVPAAGGEVRSLEDRKLGLGLLDAGNRRDEPFFAQMQQAPEGPSAEPRASRTGGLVRLGAELPVAYDRIQRHGIREWLVEPDTVPGELLAGALEGMPVSRARPEILRNEIDAEGDATYHLLVRSRMTLEGIRPRTATIDKEITVPVDAAELSLKYEASLVGEGGALLAVELPLRFGAEAAALVVNGDPKPRRQAEHPEVRILWLERRDGRRAELVFDPPLDVWVLPVRTTIRDLAGYRAVDQGIIVVALVRLEQAASASILLRLGEG